MPFGCIRGRLSEGLETLGASSTIFVLIFFACINFGRLSKRLLEPPGLDFGSIIDGLEVF